MTDETILRSHKCAEMPSYARVARHGWMKTWDVWNVGGEIEEQDNYYTGIKFCPFCGEEL